MALNNNFNLLIPQIFDNPAWEEKVILTGFVSVPNGAITTIKFDEDVYRTLQATHKDNLKPFVEWELTKAGNIRFITYSRKAQHQTGYVYNILSRSNPINPAAMNMIHGHSNNSNIKSTRMAAAGDDSQY
jgi:hypothetical protein